MEPVMRRFTLFLLLAGSALPAFAAVDDEDRRPQRDNQRAERSERAERSSRAERTEARREAAGATRARSDSDSSGQVEMATRSHQRQAVEQQSQERQFQRRERGERRYEGEAPVSGSGAIVPRQQVIRTIPDTNTTQQVGTRHRDRDRYDGRYSGNHRNWSRDWRHDRRYDWRRWRDRNRSSFRLGFYLDPFGWGYRRYSIGSYLYPSYYSSRYWLSDPWSYRLPPAWGPYRWVRYHNDAILIDTWTGEVVDVIYNFFW
jgi:hypothetical protein